MPEKRSDHANRAFIDLLFICLLVYMPILIVAIAKMNEIDPNKKVSEAKSEFMIVVEWPHERDDDVDVYVEDPNGKLVFFRRREDGLMHLDRDDVGWRNDKIRLPDGTMAEVKLNREVVSLRGIVPGEYIVNVHLYGRHTEGTCPVNIKLEKMNPYKIVTIKDLVLEGIGREKTAFRFNLDKDGKVTDLNEIEKRIATDVSSQGSNNYQENGEEYYNEGYEEEGYDE